MKSVTKAGSRVWMRMGDNDDYHDFDSMFSAGSELGGYLDSISQEDNIPMPKVLLYGDMGVGVSPGFEGLNYISLFWGDKDAQLTKKHTRADIEEFKRGIRDGAFIFLKKRNKRSSVKKTKIVRSNKSSPSGIGGMR
jgi:hypothetical protein